MRFLTTVWIAAFCAVLVLPLVQMKWPLAREEPLRGVTVPAEKPRPGLRAWFEGSFQRQFDNWFGQNIGFRPTLVRTDNQLGLSLFREVTARTGDDVILGRDHVLYQKSGLDAYNRLDLVPEERLDATAQKIRELQDGLAARGVTLLVVISPSKAEVYPEFIPPSRVLEHRLGRKTNYETMAACLRARGANLLDAHEMFAAAKTSEPYRLFPQGGIHWNAFSAGLVTQAMIEKLEALTGKRLVHIACESVALDDRPRREEAELDLADLLNVWRLELADWPYPRPIYAPRAQGDEFKPRILWVGDSLAHSIIALLYRNQVFESLRFFSYYNTEVVLPQEKGRHLEKDKLDWEKKVFSQDVIILEIAELMIDRIGWGFVEDALSALRGGAGEPRSNAN